MTQTLSTWGGNFYVSKGLGFLYNNHLRSSRTTRGAYGQLLPLSRSSSTNAPTLLVRERDGVRTPRLAVAAAGNAWILASIYSIVSAVVDGGLSAQAAVEAPRLLVGRDPADPTGATARVQIEDRFPRAGARGSDAARPRVPEDRPQGRAALRLRIRGVVRRRSGGRRRRRRSAAIARRRRGPMT